MKRIIIAVWGIICVLLLSDASIFAQIPQGGQPIEIRSIKEIESDFVWYKAPLVQNEKYSRQQAADSENYLKPLHFAHSFYVALNPENSGTWVTQDNYKIWKLGIESTDAYSINLILKKFLLPPGSRLFIYNPDQSEIIGAFTENSNTESGILPTQPVSGDKLIVQYEELIGSSFRGQFEISKISHDFVGVTLKSSDPRRPMKRTSEPCEVNINCDKGTIASVIKNSVCRIFIDGEDLCTGVLLNNTSNNSKPYVLTAEHCIVNSYKAQVSLFLFNYESPYCGSIDGDNTHSISGSTLKANFDSLDFSLVELSVPPPNYYRPYYAGWDASGYVASNTFTVHHPMGDIKKISIDNDSPVSGTYSKDYISLAFWKVKRWEVGTTEHGSSGGPLFNQNNQVIGSLTGGNANCIDPTSDFFEKFSKSWSYKSASSKQLKYWLDPGNTGLTKLDGYNPFAGELNCGVQTNFTKTDTTQIKRISVTNPSIGYFTGTNKQGYSEFAEKFSGLKSCSLSGVSIGIARLNVAGNSSDVKLTVNVYEGTETPEKLLHTENFQMNKLAREAMNYLAFNAPVTTNGNFFVSYSLGLLTPADTIALYQAKRTATNNSFYLKTNGGWKDYKTLTGISAGTSLLMELVTCNVDYIDAAPILKSANSSEFKVYPNPLTGNGILTISSSFDTECMPEVSIFNLLGQPVPFQIISEDPNRIALRLRDARVGIHFLLLETEGKKYLEKFSVIP